MDTDLTYEIARRCFVFKQKGASKRCLKKGVFKKVTLGVSVLGEYGKRVPGRYA